jgi:hypothetical protein
MGTSPEMSLTRDELIELLTIHDLHTASIDMLGDDARRQHHPEVAARKYELDTAFVAQLEAWDSIERWDVPDDAVDAMHALAGIDLFPDVYEWVAEEASYDELVDFLALEGGPDGGFDDLVAACQIGLSGEPKLELARNYWDEMGHGAIDKVHTELHRRLGRALEIDDLDREQQPVEALERSALGSLLATNRWLQPEMVGALGLTELQAGPRCEKVLAAFARVDAPAGAWPFYEVHAEVDPIHGKAWVENVVGPLADDPRWAAGMVRGARWKALVNRRFFAAMAARFLSGDAQLRAS